jgi:hypothetical protein
LTVVSAERRYLPAPLPASTKPSSFRDGDKKRYLGKGTLKAVDNINGEIAETITGLDATEQIELDRTMIKLDGTANKGRWAQTRFSPSRWRQRARLPIPRGLHSIAISAASPRLLSPFR